MADFQIDDTVDITDVVCPVTFVKAKVALEELDDGQILFRDNWLRKVIQQNLDFISIHKAVSFRIDCFFLTKISDWSNEIVSVGAVQ